MSVYYPETLQPTIEYPESDGEPVAESEPQLLSLLYSVAALRVSFQNQPDAYVVGNILFYYEEGNLKRIVDYCQKDVVTLIQLFLRFRNETLVDEGDIHA